MNLAQHRNPEPSPVRRSRDIPIPAGMLWVLLALAVLPWIGFTFHLLSDLHFSPRNAPDDPGVRTGPWGELRIHDLVIAPVDVLAPGLPDQRLATTWAFEGFTSAKLQELLRTLNLPEPLLDGLLNTNSWLSAEGAITVSPDDETVLALEPAARLRLYDTLGQTGRNSAYYQPWSMKTSVFDARLESAKFTDATRDLIRRLAFVRGGRTFFSDMAVLLNRLPDPEQRRQALRLLNSASTYQVNLVVPPGADTDALAAYWGHAGRRKDLKPILESLAQLPEGGMLDIAHVLPAFARQRLYIYPSPMLAQDGVRRDCHWTSLNFFSHAPDNRFGDAMEATRHILANYHRTGETPQFGDLVLYTLPSGDCIHSAVYLAGGLVFTKNGDQMDQPWIIMDVADLRELYSFYQHAELAVQYWREKEPESGAAVF